jgi:hypothetical protein
VPLEHQLSELGQRAVDRLKSGCTYYSLICIYKFQLNIRLEDRLSELEHRSVGPLKSGLCLVQFDLRIVIIIYFIQ